MSEKTLAEMVRAAEFEHAAAQPFSGDVTLYRMIAAAEAIARAIEGRGGILGRLAETEARVARMAGIIGGGTQHVLVRVLALEKRVGISAEDADPGPMEAPPAAPAHDLAAHLGDPSHRGHAYGCPACEAIQPTVTIKPPAAPASAPFTIYPDGTFSGDRLPTPEELRAGVAVTVLMRGKPAALASAPLGTCGPTYPGPLHGAPHPNCGSREWKPTTPASTCDANDGTVPCVLSMRHPGSHIDRNGKEWPNTGPAHRAQEILTPPRHRASCGSRREPPDECDCGAEHWICACGKSFRCAPAPIVLTPEEREAVERIWLATDGTTRGVLRALLIRANVLLDGAK